MDTRFWGPSGWQLLHLVAHEPIRTACHANAVLRFMHLLEYVLPCKYCRASFHDYIRLQPLTIDTVMDTAAFSKWMYDIHNRVNAKLRSQGLLTTANPSWADVRTRFEGMHAGLCKGTPLLGWDFMTSVAFATPAANYKPVPMPDTPERPASEIALWPMEIRNRYNLLTRTERIRYLKRWWALIPSILPCEGWRSAWAAAMQKAGAPLLLQGKDGVMRWMWKIEQAVCGALRCPTPHRSLPALCAEVGAFESKCGVARAGKTCRTRRKKQRSRVQTQRSRRGVGVL
jgi:hypothetical protein